MAVVGVVDNRDGLAYLGGLLFLAGIFEGRVKRAKVGPVGAEIELEQRTRESTSAVAVEAATPVGQFPLPEPERVVDVHRVALANDVVASLTAPTTGPLVGCTFQLYLFDDGQRVLLPLLQPGHPGPSPTFAVGEGVVGTAWATGEYAVAEGAAAFDETFGLSADKRSRYVDLAAVAAVPVTNAAGRHIAVVAAAATDPHSRLAADEGIEALVALAGAFARVLVDLLKWFGDDYDGSS